VSEGGTEQLVLREAYEVFVSGAETEVPAAAGAERPDLILIDHRGVDYSKVVFDEVSLATLEQHIGALDGPFTRTLVLFDLTQMTRDLKYPASRTLEIIADALTAARTPYESAILSNIPFLNAFMGADLFSLTSDENLKQSTASIAAALVDILESGAFDAWSEDLTMPSLICALHSDSEKSLAFLHDVMAGATVWRMPYIRFGALNALIATGQADADDIDALVAELGAELGADDPGIVSWSERSRLRFPTVEAKRTLLDTYFSGKELSFVETDSTWYLYNLYVRYDNSDEVYTGLDEVYFERVQAVIENNSNALATTLIQNFYPFGLAEQTTVERAEAWIAAHPDTESALLLRLERLVQNQKNALLGRAFDAQYTG
jgi:aminopeptidase N